MREFKKGELHSGKKGPVVKNPKTMQLLLPYQKQVCLRPKSNKAVVWLDLKNNIRCTMVNSNEEKIKSFKKSIYKK
jgi:hypothetical protein